MPRIANFTVHKNTRDKRERRKVWEHLQGCVKTAPKDIDGYALVMYRRTRDDAAYYEAHYQCRDAHDIASLPVTIGEELRRLIARNADAPR